MLRFSAFVVPSALLSAALLPNPAQAAPAPADTPPIERLPTVQVQAARGQQVADVDLPASLSTVWLDDDANGTLAMEATARTYRYLDAGEVEEQRKARAAAKAAAAGAKR